jgi:uncharacterized protein (DUF427 family)
MCIVSRTNVRRRIRRSLTFGNPIEASAVGTGMAAHEHVRIEPNSKWIRGMAGGRVAVDSKRSQFVWEHRYYPAWFFPIEEVDGELRANGSTHHHDQLGEATHFDLVAGGQTIKNGAWRHLDSPVEAVRDLVRVDFAALDAWFEEDVEVFVHPRSPEVRVDALPSSRHVVVAIDGEVVADSSSAMLLFETGLPTRFYLPKNDVRMDRLTPTTSETACPYKGWARYWDVAANGTVHADLAWGYRTPLPESEAVAGLVCFYNEKVDITVDGVPLDQPTTKFS